VIILDQEGEQNLGGQAFWSFGGLFFVDSPEQRRMRIRDSRDLAWQDWLGTAGFDRDEDFWPRRWAEAYVDFAAGEKRSWLYQQGLRIFPVVGWAERGGYLATGHGNTVPRFHVTWGTGPGVLAPFCAACATRKPRARLVPLPPSRHIAHQDRRVVDGRGRPLERQHCRARRQKFAQGRWRIFVARAGDDRHLGRHRWKS
jgi:predicted oxidoreductase